MRTKRKTARRKSSLDGRWCRLPCLTLHDAYLLSGITETVDDRHQLRLFAIPSPEAASKPPLRTTSLRFVRPSHPPVFLGDRGGLGWPEYSGGNINSF